MGGGVFLKTYLEFTSCLFLFVCVFFVGSTREHTASQRQLDVCVPRTPTCAHRQRCQLTAWLCPSVFSLTLMVHPNPCSPAAILMGLVITFHRSNHQYLQNISCYRDLNVFFLTLPPSGRLLICVCAKINSFSVMYIPKYTGNKRAEEMARHPFFCRWSSLCHTDWMQQGKETKPCCWIDFSPLLCLYSLRRLKWHVFFFFFK